LLAGSTNVVSSLWNVSRRATALLMVRFYQELKYQELKHENNLVLALQTAQRWLRDTNIRDFKQWLETSSLTFAYQSAISEYFDIIEQNRGENDQPFSSPVDWSAFCCIGKGV
jgi:CHAT domain-containing protein